MRTITLSRIFFYLLLIVLPINLGKHFIFSWSRVNGLAVDYLIPTVYVQDILSFLVVFSYLWENKRDFGAALGKAFSSQYIALYSVLLFCIILSTLLAPVTAVSMFSAMRFALYFFISIYVYLEYRNFNIRNIAVYILLPQVAFIAILACLQFAKQGSIFPSYLFFGEQPYSLNTRFVIREQVGWYTLIPPYALFRHPNILGGYFTLTLSLLFWTLTKLQGKIRRYTVYTLMLGILAFISTLSITAFLAFGLGLLWFIGKTKWLFYASVIFVVLLGFCFPLVRKLTTFEENPSVYRRAELMETGYSIASRYTLFGVGYNSSLYTYPKESRIHRDLGFLQPIHNIFILMFAESGVFAFALYLVIPVFMFVRLYKQGNPISLLLGQVLVIGSFDHYFLTIHQTLLMFFILIGCSARLLKLNNN